MGKANRSWNIFIFILLLAAALCLPFLGYPQVLPWALAMVFLGSSLILWLGGRRKEARMQQDNQEYGYVNDGVSKVFRFFILVDLEQNTYRYLCGARPAHAAVPTTGSYAGVIPYICSFLVNDEDKQKVSQDLRPESIIAGFGGEVSRVQYQYKVCHNGKEEWMHAIITCLERREGQASKVLFLWQDITDIKQEEERIQSELSFVSRREQRYIGATLTDAFCSYEINLTKDLVESVSFSRTDRLATGSLGERMAQKQAEAGEMASCRASAWLELWEPYILEDSKEDYSAWARVDYLLDCFARGESEVVSECWAQIPGGEVVCIRQSCFMSKDGETGDIIGLVVAKEITGQMRQQREQRLALEEALEQAERASKSKSVFLSNMSHDIRTPMNAVMNFTNLALNHIENTERVKNYLQKVQVSSHHLLGLLNNILDMSRIESGELRLKEQPCSLPELLNDVLSIIQPQTGAKNMELSFGAFHVVDENVISDPLQLCRVFLNLLGNAVKYTPVGGKITFTVLQNPSLMEGYGEYTFIIQDNGVGISEAFLKRIFDPFERERTATKSGVNGAGIGLTITKYIVEKMGGTIQVQSRKGEGSEFRVDLRFRLQDAQKNEEQLKELEGIRVLVVDDDREICASVCEMLYQLGIRPEWFTTGREALGCVQAAHSGGTPYDLYIIDWQMPEMSGVEMTRKLRKIVGTKPPVIILTAYDWSDIEEEVRRAGADAFCAKPLFLGTLKSVLLSVTGGAKGRTEEEKPKEQVDFAGKRVLLVDDNELNLEIAQVLLEEAGFLVETAPDGSDALDMLRRSEEYYYDAVLTDIQMPIMDGYEEAMEIRALSREDVMHMPIIAISANNMEEDREKGLRCGINAHIGKPLEMDLFLEILGNFL